MSAELHPQVTNLNSEDVWSDKRVKENKRRMHGAARDKNKWIKVNETAANEVAVNGPSITPVNKQPFDSRSSNRLTYDKSSKAAKSQKGQPAPAGGNRESNWNKKKTTFNDVETYRKETKNMSRSLNGQPRHKSRESRQNMKE